ncbi:MAG: DinB family protein [Candidatus Korobacteraceae bacterium]
MKRFLLLAIFTTLLTALASAQEKTIGGEFQALLTRIESQVVPLADAMPADKYSFAPSSGEFKGVRNFGDQVLHVAQANFSFCGVIGGEKGPAAPAAGAAKATVVQYLKDSFAFCQKSLGTLTAANAVEPIKGPGGLGSRVAVAGLLAAHNYDHYGQMVVYLRMNGMIPPASQR